MQTANNIKNRSEIRIGLTSDDQALLTVKQLMLWFTNKINCA